MSRTAYTSSGKPSNASGYTQVNVEIPKKRLSMRARLDRTMAIFVPTFITAAFGALFTYACYCIKNHIWQHWHTVTQTSTKIVIISTGQYRHTMTSDIIIFSLFGVLWLIIAIACAYWAEAWWNEVT